ncbi:MAG: hypothetical protein F2797_03440 [Actinobacteria bacterium]|nr:hypothetical protein [Actinomycetota bacterium]
MPRRSGPSPIQETDQTLDTIVNAARTEKIGDGKVWMINLETVIRVRTGERETEAI